MVQVYLTYMTNLRALQGSCNPAAPCATTNHGRGVPGNGRRVRPDPRSGFPVRAVVGHALWGPGQDHRLSPIEMWTRTEKGAAHRKWSVQREDKPFGRTLCDRSKLQSPVLRMDEDGRTCSANPLSSPPRPLGAFSRCIRHDTPFGQGRREIRC
ncbi:hypothetical protein VTI74DRAFT_6404 [Chaetomium olivicolor]